MRKRLDAARRLVDLQQQKVRLVETTLARLRGELQALEDEEQRLHGQIEGTLEGSSDIIDLLFRRLDQLTRRRVEKQAEIAVVLARLSQEKTKGEAAGRLADDVQALVQTQEERRDLLEVIERAATKSGSSFR